MSRLLPAAALIALSVAATFGPAHSVRGGAGSTRLELVTASQVLRAGRSLCLPIACENSPRQPARLASQTAKPPLRAPRPIAGRGYHVTFKDTFKTLQRRVWDNHEWWNTRPPKQSEYVRNGIFHLVSRRSQGYQSHIAATTFSSHKVFLHGYFEARMKWTKGNGSWPGFWLISNAWAKTANCATPAAEIDVFEGYGNHPRVFTGTIHRDSADWLCPLPNAINTNNWQPQTIDLTAGFHTYAVLWTATTVTWYLDGRRMMSWPVWETTNQPMFLILSMYTGGESSPDSSTPSELQTMVDWVRVWQR